MICIHGNKMTDEFHTISSENRKHFDSYTMSDTACGCRVAYKNNQIVFYQYYFKKGRSAISIYGAGWDPDLERHCNMLIDNSINNYEDRYFKIQFLPIQEFTIQEIERVFNRMNKLRNFK